MIEKIEQIDHSTRDITDLAQVLLMSRYRDAAGSRQSG
jgi:hypothetical protein